MGEDTTGSLVSARALVETVTIRAEEGDPDRCPKCEGKVFPAERRTLGGRSYHRTCFSCSSCTRVLEQGQASAGGKGEVCCQHCYRENYGPSSLPQDLSTSRDTSLIRPSSEASGCPRCGGAVFSAEEVRCKGGVFHLACTTCFTCRRQLDSRSLVPGRGQDREIYCSSCYRAKHQSSRPATPVAPTALLALQGEDACARCLGRIYESERLRHRNSLYHRACFSCKACAKILDYTLAQVIKLQNSSLWCSALQ